MQKKLSKVQRKIVKKMKDGWDLTKTNRPDPDTKKINIQVSGKTYNEWIKVNKRTLKSLREKNVIEKGKKTESLQYYKLSK